MQTSPMDAPFGAWLELETGNPLSSGEQAELRRLFAQHGLLVVRGREISKAQQIDLLSALGRIEPGENGEPMCMEVTNQHDQSTAPPGELVFHSDYAYDPNPIPGISMYGKRIDPGATPTLFANAARALERLPEDLRTEIRGRQAAHACFLYRLDAPKERSSEPEPLIARGEPGWGPAHYWTHHPLISESAFGVPMLFACRQHTDRILGLTRTESDALLASLFEILYAADNVYEHVWQEKDLVMWDNWTVQHARPEPNAVSRTLRRYHLADHDLTADYLRVAREQGLV